MFPELTVTGYPPEDLLLKPGFVADNRRAMDRIAAATERCVAIVGFVDAGRDLYNAAAICAGGQLRGIYRKRELPNYAVFDELRYFAPGDDPSQLWTIGGVAVGVSICEDAWNPNGPIADQADSGAELIVNLNASPFADRKHAARERMLATRAADASCVLVYVNQVGGQDELVFDGGSMVFDAEGELIARAPQFVEHMHDRRCRRSTPCTGSGCSTHEAGRPTQPLPIEVTVGDEVEVSRCPSVDRHRTRTRTADHAAARSRRRGL